MIEQHHVIATGTLDLTRPAPPVETVHLDAASIHIGVLSGDGIVAAQLTLPSHLDGDAIPSKLHLIVIRPDQALPASVEEILALRFAYGVVAITPPAADESGIVPDTVVAVAANYLGLFRGKETSLKGANYALVETHAVPEPPVDPPSDPSIDPPADPVPA